MDEYFDFDSSKSSFEWDEEKDRINFEKHGIRFKTAAKVFLDPNILNQGRQRASGRATI